MPRELVFATAVLKPQVATATAASRVATTPAVVNLAAARVVTTAQIVRPPAAAVPSRAATPAVKVEQLRVLQPELSAFIAKIRVPATGQPRERMTAPISPLADIVDTVLFEAPDNPAKTYYLPRYRVGQQLVSGRQQYRIAVATTPQGEAALSVEFEKFPAPEIGDAARTASEIDHRVVVLLRYRVGIGGGGAAEKELAFQEATPRAGGLSATLRFATLAERDQALFAITSAEAGAGLIVRRVLERVAIPAPAALPAPPQPGRPVIRPIFMMSEASAPVFTARAANRGVLVASTAPAQPAAGPPLYREVTRAVDCAADPTPLFLLPAAHPYLLQGIGAPAGGQPQLTPRQVAWQDGFRSYYQDAAQPWVFYDLPDAFKLARRPESPHRPLMGIRMESSDGSLGAMQVALDFTATPFVDQRRRAAALGALRRFLPAGLPQGVDGPDVQPLMADKARLFLALPRHGAPEGGFEECDKALVDLRHGIAHRVTLPLADFQSLFDALHSDASSLLFQGEVRVELGPGLSEHVPFIARMSDTNGELFDYREEPDTASGGVAVKLRNAIESPVRIEGLEASLRREAAEVPARLQGIAFDPPPELAPDQEIAFTVVPTAPLAGDGSADAVFDLQGVAVLPDAEKTWGAILDPDTPAEYARKIQVKTFREIFDAPTDQPDNRILAAVLDFERGPSVDLSPDKLAAEVELRMPISDYLLRRVDAGEYRYRLTVIRRRGRSADQDWRKDSTGILFPEIA